MKKLGIYYLPFCIALVIAILLFSPLQDKTAHAETIPPTHTVQNIEPTASDPETPSEPENLNSEPEKEPEPELTPSELESSIPNHTNTTSKSTNNTNDYYTTSSQNSSTNQTRGTTDNTSDSYSSSKSASSRNATSLLPGGKEIDTNELSADDWKIVLDTNQTDGTDTFDFIKNADENSRSNNAHWMLYGGIALIVLGIAGITFVIVSSVRSSNGSSHHNKNHRNHSSRQNQAKKNKKNISSNSSHKASAQSYTDRSFTVPMSSPKQPPTPGSDPDWDQFFKD